MFKTISLCTMCGLAPRQLARARFQDGFALAAEFDSTSSGCRLLLRPGQSNDALARDASYRMLCVDHSSAQRPFVAREV